MNLISFLLSILILQITLLSCSQPTTEIYGSGDNQYGALADGTINEKRGGLTPVVMDRGAMKNRNIREISLGWYHSMFLEEGGMHLYAAGRNDYGQLCSGFTSTAEVIPVAVKMDAVLAGIVIQKVSVGTYHSVILDSEGRVYACGSDKFGQLSRNITREAQPEALPIFLTQDLQTKRIVDIAAGWSHTMLLDEYGAVYVSGRSSDGQSGTGSHDPQLLAVPVLTDDVLYNRIITKISTVDSHGLLLDSKGQVIGLGRNGDAQLFSGNAHSPQLRPVLGTTLLGNHIVEIATGDGHSIALDSTGIMFMVGRNTEGAACQGYTTSPIIFPVSVHLAEGIMAVRAGAYHNMLIDRKGHIFHCGRGSEGQAGIGTFENHLTPVLSQFRNSSYLATGGEQTMAIVETNCTPGTVVAFDTFQSCEPCPTGYFCPYHLIQRPCPKFEWSLTGATSVQNCSVKYCSEGFVCNNGDMEPCPDGYWRFASQSGCERCPSFTTCENGSRRVSRWFPITVGALTVASCICMFACAATVTFCVGLFACTVENYSRKHRKKDNLKELLLAQNSFHSQELDEMEEKPNRAKLKLKKSFFEIDYNSLKIHERIGTGGSNAIVFRATWNRLDVAVKMFHVKMLSGENDFDDFEKEVSFMSSLRHPRLISFFGCCLSSPRVGMVMEYCSGGTVSELLLTHHQNGSSLPAKQVLRILRQVCEGMIYLHEKQVIHRDLKCENLLLTQEFDVKIADFGLSRHIERLDQLSNLTSNIGTNGFIAPEILNRKKYNEKCDVYSFSMVMYQLCTGNIHPFGDVSPIVAQALSSQDATFRPDLECVRNNAKYAHLADLMDACWRHDPNERPTFEALLDILLDCEDI